MGGGGPAIRFAHPIRLVSPHSAFPTTFACPNTCALRLQSKSPVRDVTGLFESRSWR